MRVLGIDPGSRVTGFAVVEARGAALHPIGFGVIRPAAGEMAGRLAEIFAGVARVVAELRPEALAIESVFLARNAQSALKLGQARGAAICAAAQAGLPVFEYAPRAVKLAVVGSGRAHKAQVQHMMRQILRIDEPLAADAADALAVAVCHSHTQQTQGYASRRLTRVQEAAR
ncbi:crossover junction endodeoxyribonuclease RuvC [Thioalkalivibrio paradoxus]|uniref:Crossover junction endodeoxyribonuclease RuvC n=1 Tax=Thioalkalivibrio paradoxus ARh 1 TaxID=713585 RepID=W0DKI5_9GAMM|nr:crossover junction endodeoxyribonuclease RuvC [Thioalkalivibrio paradoxus]AHE97400.1 Holliday junction resolvase [Thioalkalivibrio paradoxus ARh 1]